MSVDEQLKKAVDILSKKSLQNIVDMVIYPVEPGVFSVLNHEGKITFEYFNKTQESFKIVEQVGKNPVSNQDLRTFGTIEDQRANMFADNGKNSYPFAYERISQVFDHLDSPDLIVLHTPGHYFKEKGGYLGEHGSLDILQSRAPFIISGNCINHLGFVDGHIKAVDVMPTLSNLILKALNLNPNKLSESYNYLLNLDGKQNSELIDRCLISDRSFDRLVVFLLDGCNSNILYSMIQAGELKNLSYLKDNGVALNQGTIASFPSVTLANHTTLLTGYHPGHHGVLHNAWWDRKNQKEIITESPTTWHTSMQYLKDGVKTMFEVLNSNYEDLTTVAINEFADCGATYSTFDLIRNMRTEQLLNASNMASDPLAKSSSKFIENQEYQLASGVDHLAMWQMINILDGSWDQRSFKVPDFAWINLTLTDVSFHEAGPDSEMARHALLDTDERIGRILEKLSAKKLLDTTLFVVLADHGMEETNPLVTGDWDLEMISAGLSFVDESNGFIYFK